jgi:hypothetical protein
MQNPMNYANAEPAQVAFTSILSQIQQRLVGVEGWLTDREVEFLALAAARPTADGDILEIGSFRGRSTIVLALASHATRPADDPIQPVIAIDPLLDDDPLLEKPLPSGTAKHIFHGNLRRAGVQNLVEFHQGFSYQVAPSWNRPLRLLWIDGDHSYPSTKQDFDLFTPYLADGAILAMHDVLSPYEGCIRVFLEDVLASPFFSAAGLCGSIGWAQFQAEGAPTTAQQNAKRRLAMRLERLLPYHCQDRPLQGWSKLHYKLLRARVPHAPIDPAAWEREVAGTAIV